jgi:diguanylate cyclase (GGDEF)-like protein/PAS domain S-box-containing protein
MVGYYKYEGIFQNMSFIESITAIQILIGAAIMLFSIAAGFKIKKDVSQKLRAKWTVTLSLMFFFFFGYIVTAIILILNIAFPLEIITGTIFLGGACFVYLVIRLSQLTIRDINEKDKHINGYAKILADRTSELEKEITERKKVEEALTKREEQYRSLVESTDDSIYVVDRNYGYVFINKKHLTRIGLSDDRYVGRLYSEFHSPEETKAFIEKADVVFNRGESVHHEYQSLRDGRYFLLTLSPAQRVYGTITAITVLSKEITDYKKMQEQLRELSLTDQLTCIYNRRGLFTLIDPVLKQAKRQKKVIFMLYADIDNMKEINDTFGHKEGDAALIETANILKTNYRESDIIARIGGDEFVVIPVGTAGDDIEKIVDRLEKSLEIYNSKRKHDYRLSLSIGVTYYDPENPCSIEELLIQADELMYKHKRNKKNS